MTKINIMLVFLLLPMLFFGCSQPDKRSLSTTSPSSNVLPPPKQNLSTPEKTLPIIANLSEIAPAESKWSFLAFANLNNINPKNPALSISNFFVAQAPTNLGQEHLIDAKIDGKNIKEIFTFAAKYDYNANGKMKVVYYKKFDLSKYKDQRPNFLISDSWDGRALYITNFANSISALGYYNYDSKDYVVYGRYNKKNAVLHFNTKNFSLTNVELLEFDRKTNEVKFTTIHPKNGDIFEPVSILFSYYNHYNDYIYNYNYTTIYPDSIEYNENLWIDQIPVDKGYYDIGIGIVDDAGNLNFQTKYEYVSPPKQEIRSPNDYSIYCYYDSDCPYAYYCDYSTSKCKLSSSGYDYYDYSYYNRCYSDYDCPYDYYCSYSGYCYPY